MAELPTMGQLPKIWRDEAGRCNGMERTTLRACADELEAALMQSANSILAEHERRMHSPGSAKEKRCRHCSEPIEHSDGRWRHTENGFGMLTCGSAYRDAGGNYCFAAPAAEGDTNG